MRFQTLAIITLLIFSSFAFGRKPAVEDFVGIEVESVEVIPQGTETLFNFEKEIGGYEAARPSNSQQYVELRSEAWSTSTMMGIIFILGLPFLSWLLVMNHLRKKASIETASNIEILEKYRTERELARKTQSEAAREKKAS